MSLHDDESFDAIEARLEAERPRLDAQELDRLSLRCRSRITRSQPRKEQSMRSRIAIVAMLAFGLVFSTAGVGMAISGSSGSGSAGNAQYPTTPQVHRQPRGEVKGDNDSGNGGGVLGANDQSPPPSSGAQPAEATPAPAQAVQETRQLSTDSGSQLPFTGFAVIPIILIGVALLVGGLFLRRRSGPSHT
jgi:hypothetical protein